jgi:SOS-response transcriptional repressor LexA
VYCDLLTEGVLISKELTKCSRKFQNFFTESKMKRLMPTLAEVAKRFGYKIRSTIQ